MKMPDPDATLTPWGLTALYASRVLTLDVLDDFADVVVITVDGFSYVAPPGSAETQTGSNVREIRRDVPIYVDACRCVGDPPGEESASWRPFNGHGGHCVKPLPAHHDSLDLIYAEPTLAPMLDKTTFDRRHSGGWNAQFWKYDQPTRNQGIGAGHTRAAAFMVALLSWAGYRVKFDDGAYTYLGAKTA